MEEMLSEKEQRTMRGLSKAIYVITCIIRFFCYIAAAVIVICLIAIPMFLNCVDTKKQTIKIAGKEFTYKIDNDKMIVFEGKKEVINEKIEITSDKNLEELISKHSTGYYIGVSESFLGVALIIIVLLICFFKNMSKLFKNIYKNETPFILENSKYLNHMALYLLLICLFPTIVYMILDIIFKLEINLSLDLMDLLFVLIISCIALVFNYGCKLEEKKAK